MATPREIKRKEIWADFKAAGYKTEWLRSKYKEETRKNYNFIMPSDAIERMIDEQFPPDGIPCPACRGIDTVGLSWVENSARVSTGSSFQKVTETRARIRCSRDGIQNRIYERVYATSGSLPQDNAKEFLMLYSKNVPNLVVHIKFDDVVKKTYGSESLNYISEVLDDGVKRKWFVWNQSRNLIRLAPVGFFQIDGMGSVMPSKELDRLVKGIYESSTSEYEVTVPSASEVLFGKRDDSRIHVVIEEGFSIGLIEKLPNRSIKLTEKGKQYASLLPE